MQKTKFLKIHRSLALGRNKKTETETEVGGRIHRKMFNTGSTTKDELLSATGRVCLQQTVGGIRMHTASNYSFLLPIDGVPNLSSFPGV